MSRKKKNSSRTRNSAGRMKPAGKVPSMQRSTDFNSAPAPAAVLDQQKLQQLYSSMLKCRMLHRRMQEISNVQQLVAGREAVLAGALAHSRPDDCVITEQNDALVDLLRGNFSSLAAQLVSGLPIAGQPQPAMPSPGQPAFMRGMAAAKDLLDSGRAVLVFCGEDSAALSFQQEQLALAAKHKAPMVCFVEVSLRSLDDKRRPGSKRRKLLPPQFPVIVVDGVDVVAIFRVAQEAVRRARTGHGPSLIQCVTTEDGGKDPLQFIERYMRAKNFWSDEWQAKTAQESATQLESALLSLRSRPLPVF